VKFRIEEREKRFDRIFVFLSIEKCNTMTIELSKYKERDTLQMNDLTELRQSSSLFERVMMNRFFVL